MDKEDWLNGDLCEKDGLSFCAACEPNEFSPIVYATSNGSAFHQSKNCEWLLKGIKKAKGDFILILLSLMGQCVN